MGIRYVGERTAQLLAEHFGTMEKLQSAEQEELESIREVGPKVAESIFNFFRGKQNLKVLEKLRKAGLDFKQATARAQRGPLEGKTFVLTGTLPGLSRPEASKMIVQAGGKVTTTVSKKDRLRAGRFRPRLKTHQGQEARHLHPRREAIACSLGTVSFSILINLGIWDAAAAAFHRP